MKEKIETGTLLKVEKSFLATTTKTFTYAEYDRGHINPSHVSFDTTLYINKGWIIEIRYPHEWHFRTSGNTYAYAPDDILREHCSYFGEVEHKTRRNNDCELDEILREKLYTEAAPNSNDNLKGDKNER